MASSPHLKTLFHLVPLNQPAHDTLLHPDNARFVSGSAGDRPGLEVGFHVPSKPGGHVITRLGRDADLILRQVARQQPVSAVHVAFEINPATHHVLLTVRSKRLSSVTFAPFFGEEEDGSVDRETITGSGVILYGQDYQITMASYMFMLVWPGLAGTQRARAETLKRFTLQGYHSSLQRVQGLRSRDRPTDVDASEVRSWHVTRLNTAKQSLFKDIVHLRQEQGAGAFGTVYKAVDVSSGHHFAIKVLNLADSPSLDVETARAILHREIKVMERLKHEHIIEYLGYQHFDTLHPEIFMSLRDGALNSLAKSPDSTLSRDKLSLAVLQQMLCALDYLASLNLVHRDVKPDNILYARLGPGRYLFQLADFGLAHHLSLAKTICGTGYLQAPELLPHVSNVHAGQSPKMDIWSLFATIVAVHSAFREFPPHTTDYRVVLRALKDKARTSVKLEPMARLDPEHRASAAQMLLSRFDGEGLTTPRAQIPPLEAVEPSPSPSPARETIDRPRARDNGGRAAPLRPLVVYPPRSRAVAPAQHRQRSPRTPPALPGSHVQPAAPRMPPARAHRGGVVKRRSEPAASRARVVEKPRPRTRPSPEPSRPALAAPPEMVFRVPGMYVDSDT